MCTLPPSWLGKSAWKPAACFCYVWHCESSDSGAHGVVVSHPLRMGKALGSTPHSFVLGFVWIALWEVSASFYALLHFAAALSSALVVDCICAGMPRVSMKTSRMFCCVWHYESSHSGAHGVVISHPLRMRKALGSIPSVSMHSMLHVSWAAGKRYLSSSCPLHRQRFSCAVCRPCILPGHTAVCKGPGRAIYSGKCGAGWFRRFFYTSPAEMFLFKKML